MLIFPVSISSSWNRLIYSFKDHQCAIETQHFWNQMCYSSPKSAFPCPSSLPCLPFSHEALPVNHQTCRGRGGRCLGALLRHIYTRHGLKSLQISVYPGEMRLTSTGLSSFIVLHFLTLDRYHGFYKLKVYDNLVIVRWWSVFLN